jgi:prophage regulatory protein
LEESLDHPTNNLTAERCASISRADVRFIRLNEVLAICGKSRSSVYDAIKKKIFPEGGETSGAFIGLDQK